MRDSPSSLRFFFDENLSHRIPTELRHRGYDVSWVGDTQSGAPDRGTEDSEVLLFASETGRIIVTSDRGVVLICAQRRQSVIWFNPHGRRSPQLRRREQAALIYNEINQWVRLYAESMPPVCIRVLKTGSKVLTLEEATVIAKKQTRKRTGPKRGTPKPRPLGPLLQRKPNRTPDGNTL